MINLIQILSDKGFAREAQDDSVYFKISKLNDYGKLSNLNKNELKIGVSRINMDEYNKDNVRDFVPWKAWSEKDDDNF